MPGHSIGGRWISPSIRTWMRPWLPPIMSGSVTLSCLRTGLAQAIAYLERALAIRTKKFGASSPEVTGTLLDLASAQNRALRFSAAEATLRLALKNQASLTGKDRLRYGNTMFRLASVLVLEGNYEDAQVQFPPRGSARIAQIAGQARHAVQVAEVMVEMGDALRHQNKNKEAETVLRSALAIAQKAGGPDSQAVSDAENNLALAVEAQGRYPEAETLLLHSLDIAEKEHAERKAIALSRRLGNLAGLYRRMGRSFPRPKAWPSKPFRCARRRWGIPAPR